MRRTLRVLGWLVLGLGVCAAGFALLLPRIELGSFVAARASAGLGRAVEIGGLRVTLGRDVTIALHGLRIANLPDGSAPDMVRLERFSGRIALLALLRGTLVVQDAEAEGFHLLLERDAARRRNWRFGPSDAAPEKPEPSTMPLVHALRLARSEIVVRTSGGAALTTRIESARLSSADPLVSSVLDAEGSYNGAPIVARIALGAIAALRAGQPLPVTLHARSGDTTLEFDGTARDPMNADGAEGRLQLRAPTPDAVLQMAQFSLPITLDLTVAGIARRDGNLWQVKQVEGSLFDSPFTGQLLEMKEGAEGEPDAIIAELDFARVDLNRILGARPSGAAAQSAHPDVPLLVPPVPDPQLDVRIAAREFVYAALDAGDLKLVASQSPDQIAVEELLMTVYGARFHASGTLEPAADGTRVAAAAALLEGEVESLRRALGLRSLPLSGQVQARMSIASEGATVNHVFHQAKVGAVLAMTGGTISREVIEMASTNVRALFRTARGSTRLSCLLAVIDMEGRRGEASPLRIRAATGTITGQAKFDLSRQTVDLVIGSQSDTTEFLALDVPVRVHGSFADPDIGLSDWSPAGRRQLSAGDDVSGLPPALAAFARANPCYQAPRRR
jgi:uncharacterized protein involved in outer membrane biogenesis